MSKTKTNATKYTRRAVYTGRRLTTKGVYQRFELLPERTEMWFRGIKGVHLGWTYECSASAIATRPKFVESADHKSLAEWEVADALVDARNQEKRQEAKLRALSTPAINRAVEAIEPLIAHAGILNESALVRLLVRRAYEKQKRGGK